MRSKAKQFGFLTPRSIAVVVILLAMLLIPLWWLSEKSEQTHAELAKEKAIAQGPANISTPQIATAAVNNPEAFGLTWGMQADDKLPPDAVMMGCHGQPRDTITQPHAESCNPYAGDSSCRLALPVLCFQQTGSNEGMPAGSLASTQPVAGFVIGSVAQANARCEKELGAGWRMAEHHDGGGWSLTAKRSAQLDPGLRHWVHINNQPGNCWNNKDKP
ncbi:hypothetical protein [Variovorax sp. PCZ-1]|uniref:hypothetical protein n=1 Tax=Variovorax sp. PCZ-1 TaxID=2835533 RepID=UPI001BD1341D|nr:hypothetical protein [Variovorax sp. PCZ-1]MBS7808717.1 hypothetical protein [Variovorax sp. PCZ-1]